MGEEITFRTHSREAPRGRVNIWLGCGGGGAWNSLIRNEKLFSKIIQSNPCFCFICTNLGLGPNYNLQRNVSQPTCHQPALEQTPRIEEKKQKKRHTRKWKVSTAVEKGREKEEGELRLREERSVGSLVGYQESRKVRLKFPEASKSEWKGSGTFTWDYYSFGIVRSGSNYYGHTFGWKMNFFYFSFPSLSSSSSFSLSLGTRNVPHSWAEEDFIWGMCFIASLSARRSGIFCCQYPFRSSCGFRCQVKCRRTSAKALLKDISPVGPLNYFQANEEEEEEVAREASVR